MSHDHDHDHGTCARCGVRLFFSEVKVCRLCDRQIKLEGDS